MTDWTTQEIRDRAAALLDVRGWSRGGVGEKGPISADWAIALASGEAHNPGPEEGGPYLATMSELEATIGRGSLLDWEMEPGRTAEQVIRLLRDGSVAGGTYAPLSPEDEEQGRLAWERFRAAMDRQAEAVTQMRARSGPIYDLARERSRIVSEAYRAAGRPRDITMVKTPDGWTYRHQVGHRSTARFEPATEDEWNAWVAWCRERERLRRELGIGRYAKPPGG